MEKSRMALLRVPRRPGLLILRVLALGLAGGVAVGWDQGARALTGTTGPISVTISPTDNLTDGQAISISATANSGTFTEIRAHICMLSPPAAPVIDTFTFGFQGQLCFDQNSPVFASGPLGAGDFETFAAFNNATSGSLNFKAGIGSVTWFNELGEGPFALQCDSTHQCDLVVQFQSNISPNTFFFTAPLSYAGTSQAPAITSANNATFAVGSAGTFTVTATGNPTPTLS